MLTDAYEELTDQVQEALMAGEIDGATATTMPINNIIPL